MTRYGGEEAEALRDHRQTSSGEEGPPEPVQRRDPADPLPQNFADTQANEQGQCQPAAQ